MAEKPEKAFWQWLQPVMSGFADVQRHEDKYSVGIPDVSFGFDGINGWIELKACAKWPTKGLPKYTNKQANWITNRGVSGGHCFIMARIGTKVAIWSWRVAYVLLERVSEDDAIRVWDGNLSIKDLREILREC